ncbi:MAG: ornithine carbamoyltransferase [Acidobacteriia bacterium]|nr:ornithine carbamoyltransferase [Terriglobia bacterium]
MAKRDFITVRTYTPAEVRKLIDDAIDIKSHPEKYADTLKGKALAMIFEKPSLRTRVTFNVGIHQLGGFAIYLSPAEINLGKRESVADVARNLERMVQGVMARTFSHKVVEELAEHAHIPVINGLTDYNHPCQAMADYMTLLEIKKKFAGMKLAYVGDGNNVAVSLIHTAARLGVHLAVATPPGYEPNPEVVQWGRTQGAVTGCTIDLTHDPLAAVKGADAIYTDVWTSMGQEAESATRLKIFRPYQVNEELFAHARPDAIFLHCLPAHRGEEVTDGVMESPRSVVFQQAENRLHAQKAIMLNLMR